MFCFPAFLLYAAVVLAAVFILVFYIVPQYGQTHIMVYIGVCSLVGSLSVSDSILFVLCCSNLKFGSYFNLWINLCYNLINWQVMSVKALGIALKLTFSGMNQLIYPQTWIFTIVVFTCIITQMNYLNKVYCSFNDSDCLSTLICVNEF